MSVWRPPITALVLSLSLAGCDEDPDRHTADVLGVTAADVEGVDAVVAELSTASLTLPFSGKVSSLAAAFEIVQTGGGRGGQFRITNSTSPAIALFAGSAGQGSAFSALNFGHGSAATVSTSNLGNRVPALTVNSSSTGSPGFAAALHVRAKNPNSGQPGTIIETSGKGTALTVDHKGPTGALATFRTAGVNMVRFTRTGRGFFNGGTQTGGADVAEAFEVEGKVGEYEPGDVLTISETSDRKVEKSSEPYSTLVVGVYATKPGVLLTERDIDASLDDMVPLGVVGVIPTKVSAENGPIGRGNLLVTASIPGHAMAADPARLQFGMVLGKALESFPGPGTGTIRVLVNVK